mgnify:CR=1 FL=1
MRNLKRALSLALASVMLLGMMVVGTSAASYKDVDSKDNLEAIEVLKMVGIMTGDDKGNFNPDKMVTRNEMAVVMCNLLGLKTGGTHPFTDVPAWAAPYVAACYNNGIIAGVSATQFNGDANVTAVQAGLMLMKALGYFGYAGEFGDSWKLSVVKQADKINLYDGINAYTDQVMTRNEISKMVLNALEATVMVVTEQGGVQVDGNGVSVNVKPTYKYEAAANNSGKDYRSDSHDNVMQLCEKIYGNDLKKIENYGDGDNFGRPATKWTYKDEDITSAKEPEKVYVTDFDADELKDLKDDYTIANDVDVYVNGVKAKNLTVAEVAGRDYKGTTVELYADGKTITRVVVIQGYLAKVTDVDDEDITIRVYNPWINADQGEDYVEQTIENKKKDDDDWFDRLTAQYKKNSYFVVYTKGAEADADVLDTDDVTTVSGKVTTKKTTSLTDGYNGNFTMGGTKYTLASGYNEVTINAGDEYDFYLDPNGYVIGAKAASDEAELNEYLFVKGNAKDSGFDVIAKVVFMDGTSKTVTIDKKIAVNGTETDVDEAKDIAGDKFYTYKTDKDGNYELTEVTDSTSAKVYQAKAANSFITDAPKSINGVNASANSKTTYIAKDKVYTGVKNAPEVGDAQNTVDVYYLIKSGRLYVVYTGTEGTSSTSANELVYVLSTDKSVGKNDDKETYYVYDVIKDGKKDTLTTKNGNLQVDLYKITSYEDDTYAKLTQATPANNELVNTETAVAGKVDYSNGTLTLTAANGTKTAYILADDVKIFTIDDTTVKSIGATSIKSRVADGFTALTLIEVDKDNSDIATLYMAKP